MERWKHIVQEHPRVIYVEEIKQTMKRPSTIRQSTYDKNVRWYYSFNKQKKRYLMVSVKYLNGDGFIITAYYTRNIK